jgi:hypothetical protein
MLFYNSFFEDGTLPCYHVTANMGPGGRLSPPPMIKEPIAVLGKWDRDIQSQLSDTLDMSPGSTTTEEFGRRQCGDKARNACILARYIYNQGDRSMTERASFTVQEEETKIAK